MNGLQQLDAVITELAGLLFGSAPMNDWRVLKLYAKYAPDGSVSGHDYDFLLDSGSLDQASAPAREARHRIKELTERHWRLTQDFGLPRWYKMSITVESSGRFGVDFEYKDDYKESDMMLRG